MGLTRPQNWAASLQLATPKNSMQRQCGLQLAQGKGLHTDTGRAGPTALPPQPGDGSQLPATEPASPLEAQVPV